MAAWAPFVGRFGDFAGLGGGVAVVVEDAATGVLVWTDVAVGFVS